MSQHPAPAFTAPEPHGFLYLGFQAEPRQRLPFYRQTSGRRSHAVRLVAAADAIGRRPDVVSVRVFRAVLIPPLPGAPRYDLVMLVRTTWVEQLGATPAWDEIAALDGEVILAGRIGETEAGGRGAFLFNHFSAGSGADPVGVWRSLTGWYTRKTGVDNSTALRATEPSQFPFVNYARLPAGPVPFLVNQLARPSFHKVVRAALDANDLRALPAFHRLIHSTGP